MSVQLKILSACVVFVVIIATLGALARRQGAEMGRLAVGIYDHAFIGMSYVDQAQADFLRLEAADHVGGQARREAVQSVLDRLNVAVERATSDRTRVAGRRAIDSLVALRDASPDTLAARLAAADRALTKLVNRFSADGLDTRDAAEDLAKRGARLVLIQIGVAICLAAGVGWFVGRSLSRPLVLLVRVIGALASGDLNREIAPALLRRHDEIGAVARAASVFRQAMQENARSGEEHERIQQATEQDKQQALRRTADSIENETKLVAERSGQSSALLAGRVEELAASAARVLICVDAVTEASSVALERSRLVAAAGEELSASAQEIASQVGDSAAEIATASLAGERARRIIEALTVAVGEIGAVARLIGSIAGQTNLLALNATIEAAHAGAAGRGFAVVASEVKALAAQTAQSTSEIARNASTIEDATRDVVQAFGEVIGRVVSIERITQAVAAAAKQQTAATNNIALNVAATADAVRMVTAQIGSMTEEAKSTDVSAGEMRVLAGDVSERIGELREVMVRIARTSSEAADRRQDKRLPVERAASVILNGKVMPAICADLAIGGAKLRIDQALPAGARLVLRLDGFPDLPGTVVEGGNVASMGFDWTPEAAPPELRAWLTDRATA